MKSNSLSIINKKETINKVYSGVAPNASKGTPKDESSLRFLAVAKDHNIDDMTAKNFLNHLNNLGEFCALVEGQTRCF